MVVIVGGFFLQLAQVKFNKIITKNTLKIKTEPKNKIFFSFFEKISVNGESRLNFFTSHLMMNEYSKKFHI